MDLWALADLSTPWAIHAVSTLRVAQRIAEGHSEISALATACGAHPESLCRVLRHLIAKGVFEEPEPGHFALNDAAREFLNPGLELGLDLESFGGIMANAWTTLLEVVRTGKPARDFWRDLDNNPKAAADFDALMGPAGHGTPDPEVLLDPTDWDRVRTVVDVGGGTGALLAEVLRGHPHVRGVLVDLPRAIARSRELFEAAGVADRAATSSQSFFDPLPAGHDVYLLKSVLADWPDREAGAILRRCAEAARPAGRVVILNGVTPDDTPSPELLMMVLVAGKDRTLAEFTELAAASGLTVSKAARQASGRFVVECRPA